jgi:hypothetical protein
MDRMVLIGLTRVLRSEDSVRSALYPLADIHGRILNENGEPLAGATVVVKGTTITSQTDEQGNFHINTGEQLKPVLQISFVGYLTEEYPLRGRDNFTIKLRQDIRSLSDIVIVGYGEQRKRDVTGAISTVKAEEIAKRPLVRVEQALQGTTAGVAVQSPNGMPGTPLSVRIRGVNSITGSNRRIYRGQSRIDQPFGYRIPGDPERCFRRRHLWFKGVQRGGHHHHEDRSRWGSPPQCRRLVTEK